MAGLVFKAVFALRRGRPAAGTRTIHPTTGANGKFVKSPEVVNAKGINSRKQNERAKAKHQSIFNCRVSGLIATGSATEEMWTVLAYHKN